MKKQLSNTVSTRVGKFLKVLTDSPLEESISITVFRKIVEEEEPPSKTLSNEDQRKADAAIERKVRYSLNLAEGQLGGGRAIVREDHHIKVTAAKATTFDRRLSKGVPAKLAVADALLEWLFGIKVIPVIDAETFAASPQKQAQLRMVCKEDKGLHKRLERKLENLRRTSVLTMLIDAGTTTHQFVERFLQTKSLPIKVQVKERVARTKEFEDQTSQRLITPIIITNSVPIAAAVGGCNQHNFITLKLIGGTEISDRRSICGEGAMLWLKACQAAGIIATVDLAIIGTTGYIGNYVGNSLPALGCHESSEANLKAEMLKLASNGLRICLMDSRKLVGAEFNCCFAAVTLSMMDVIVIDSGFDGNQSRQAVRDMCETANEHGVAVLVVDLTTAPAKSAKADRAQKANEKVKRTIGAETPEPEKSSG